MQETSHTTISWLEHNKAYYWRVAAGNICGLSQGTSANFVTGSPASLLLVDDDDNDPDVQAYYTDGLDALGYDYEVWDTWNTDDEPSQAILEPYQILVWFVGDEWGDTAGPGDDGESALKAWLDSGNKCLILTGQDYLWNRGNRDFVRDYLGVADFDSDVSQTRLAGVGEAFDGLGPYALAYPFHNFSDAVTPTEGASTAFVGDQGIAGVMRQSVIYKTMLWAFPFEAIPTDIERQEILSAALDWCGVKPDPHDIFFPLINP